MTALARLWQRIPRNPARFLRERIVPQWLWFLPWVDAAKVGLDRGPYTWLREWRSARLARPVRLCLLEYPRARLDMGRLMAHWINERSSLVRASVNEGLDEADLVWVFTQDPLTPASDRAIRKALARTPSAAIVLNHPDAYNAYHDPGCFERLRVAGVRVPRSEFSEADRGLMVVYKAEGRHAAEKTLEPYRGERPGRRAFEFVDGRGADGRYRRYRAFYFCGAIRPSKVIVARHWNAYTGHMEQMEYTFRTTSEERAQIRLLARTLGLDYFAVDYLRTHDDGHAVFLDINVYPIIQSLPRTTRMLGLSGLHHTFETRRRLGLPEPMGRPVEQLFDDAILQLMTAGDVRYRRADPSDWTAVLAVLKGANFHHIPSPEMPSFDLEKAFVAELQGEIVGVAGYTVLEDGKGKTTLLAVKPEHRGLRIGERLQRMRMEELARLGCSAIVTNADLPDVIAWYKRKFGYREVGSIPKLHDFGAPDIDQWVTLEAPLPLDEPDVS